MSKITNTILMIKLLSNGRVYSVKELSENLVLLREWLDIIKNS